MIKWLIFALGVVLFLMSWGISLELISAPSTIANIIGVLMAVSIVYIMINTRFLTNIKFKKR